MARLNAVGLEPSSDSGAARTVLPIAVCPKGTVLMLSNTRLRAANGTSLTNLGKLEFVGNVRGGPLAKISAAISPDIGDCALIGKRDLQALGILPHDFPAVHLCSPRAIATVKELAMGSTLEKPALSKEQIDDIETAIKRIEKTDIGIDPCNDCTSNSNSLRKIV